MSDPSSKISRFIVFSVVDSCRSYDTQIIFSIFKSSLDDLLIRMGPSRLVLFFPCYLFGILTGCPVDRNGTDRCVFTDSISNLTCLENCKIIEGSLVISGNIEEVDTTEISIKKITGCLTVVGTNLTNIDFLLKQKIETSCTGFSNL